MAILIGGSPSTGSSLLRRILNRHSRIFCGSESALFCKPALYEDWHKNRHRILRKSVFGLKNAGYHHFIGLSMEDDYGYDQKQLDRLIKSIPNSFSTFISAFYQPLLQRSGKSIWAEKTPGNIFCFKQFSKLLPEGKLIHIVRQPQDCIASLVNRGMPLYQACVTYLLNTATGLSYDQNLSMHVIKYEDLVLKPESTLNSLFEYLELDYEAEVLEAEPVSNLSDHMQGWQYREVEKVGTASVGRFNVFDAETKRKFNSYITTIALDDTFKYPTIDAVADKLGYKLELTETDPSLMREIKSDRRVDIIKKTIKFSNYNLLNYPVRING